MENFFNRLTSAFTYLSLDSRQAWIALIIGATIIAVLFKPVRLFFGWIKFKWRVHIVVKKLILNNNDKIDEPGQYLASLFLSLYNEQGRPNSNDLYLTDERFVKNKSLGLRTMARTLEELALVNISTKENKSCAKGKDDKFAKAVWGKINKLRKKKII